MQQMQEMQLQLSHHAAVAFVAGPPAQHHCCFTYAETLGVATARMQEIHGLLEALGLEILKNFGQAFPIPWAL